MPYLYALKVGKEYLSVLFVASKPIIHFEPLYRVRKDYAIFYTEREIEGMLSLAKQSGYAVRKEKVRDLKTGEWL